MRRSPACSRSAPDAVRERALGALDALGPPTELGPDERQLICDYLLSQLPAAEVRPQARELLASSPAAREWAVALTPRPGARRGRSAAADPAAATAHGLAVRGQHASPAPERPPSSRQRRDRRDRARPGGDHRGRSSCCSSPITTTSSTSGLAAADTHATADDHRARRTTSYDHARARSSTLAQINLPLRPRRQQGGRDAVILQRALDARDRDARPAHPAQHQAELLRGLALQLADAFREARVREPGGRQERPFSDVNACCRATRAATAQLIVTTETAQKPTHPGPVLLRGTITGLS